MMSAAKIYTDVMIELTVTYRAGTTGSAQGRAAASAGSSAVIGCTTRVWLFPEAWTYAMYIV